MVRAPSFVCALLLPGTYLVSYPGTWYACFTVVQARHGSRFCNGGLQKFRSQFKPHGDSRGKRGVVCVHYAQLHCKHRLRTRVMHCCCCCCCCCCCGFAFRAASIFVLADLHACFKTLYRCLGNPSTRQWHCSKNTVLLQHLAPAAMGLRCKQMIALLDRATCKYARTTGISLPCYDKGI